MWRPMPKSERPAILSLHERELIKQVDEIRSGKVKNKGRAPSRLAQLLPDLDKRLSALPKDLEIILESKALRPFLKHRIKQFNLVFAEYQKIQDRIQPDYNYSTWRIRYVRKPLTELQGMKKWENPKKKRPQRYERHRSYWLDISDTNAPEKPTLENFYRPEYALKGIENYELKFDGKKVNLRDILVEALELQKKGMKIFPLSDKEAKSIHEIRQIMEQRHEDKETIDIPRIAAEKIKAITDPKEWDRRMEELFKIYGSQIKKVPL